MRDHPVEHALCAFRIPAIGTAFAADCREIGVKGVALREFRVLSIAPPRRELPLGSIGTGV